MKESHLEHICVHIPGKQTSTPLEQAEEEFRLAILVVDELRDAREKCHSITHIEGERAYVVRLRMTGQTSVEHIGITYVSNGKRHRREYSKEEFYDL